MSIFLRPLSQLKTSDLEELLQDRAVENARLEFKLQVPDKDETLKKLSSLANTFGGYMVVGAKANSSDGRIEALPGVDVQPGYRQKIVDWCFSASSPPLTVEISDPIPVPSSTSKVCYVIYSAESDLAPHFLNGRKGLWVRTDEFSARFEARLANENELRHLLDRRKLVRDRRMGLLERSRKRFDTYTHEITQSRGPYLELCVVPRFPSRPLCDQAILSPLLVNKPMLWRGVTFPLSSSTAISQHESALVLGAAGQGSMIEANIWGMAFYCAEIADSDNPRQLFGIYVHGFVAITILFVRHAQRILNALGYSGSVHIQTTLRGMRGIPWLYGPSAVYSKQGSEVDDKVEFPIATTTDYIDKTPDEVVAELLRYVFFAVNWPGMITTPQELEKLITTAYQYNMWGDPKNPRI